MNQSELLSEITKKILDNGDEETVEVCAGCGNTETTWMGEDGIAWCESCECVCEGNTEVITMAEYEKRNG